LRSVNGPQLTSIEGDWAYVRCVYLTNGAGLSGFTLRNGRMGDGAGAWCESTNAILSNCVLVGNFAGGSGGGAYQGTLNRCMFINNGATNGGGACLSTLNDCMLTGTYLGGGALSSTLNRCAITNNDTLGARGSTLNNCLLAGNNPYLGADSCTLNNCTVTGNSGGYAGGATYSALNNCIIYSNSAYNAGWGPNYYDCTLTNCCTLPLPSAGTGNITNAPLFVDVSSGDYRLQSGSPCINAGNNAFVATATDLDGNPRIVNGTVDIGAYEFQGPSGLTGFHAWLAGYGLPTDGSADYVDSDKDGMNNWQEWICGTNPTNAASVLRLLTPVPAGTNVTVSWQSALGIGYFLERSTNLGYPGSFSMMTTNLPGQVGTTSFTDTNAVRAGQLFYRVGVGN
jgi:hypothetical protein